MLEEAIRIGEELLKKAVKDKNGLSWETMILAPDKKVAWFASEGIYAGTSGIAMFFMELYRQTQNKKYLDASSAALEWVDKFCEENPTDYYAFFTGRLGAAFAMQRMFELTGESAYTERALKIARDAESFISKSATIDDLINGISGTLLGLLHLHSLTKNEMLLGMIDRFTGRLIENAHHAAEGLYWDRSPKTIRGLCGFSHGTAGIGFAFLELGKYFKNDSFYQVAELAFKYEEHYFNPATGNWPDFRKGIHNETDQLLHEKNYSERNIDFFTGPGDMAAWCHGAPGIGLSRIRAYELLGASEYRKELETAITKTRKANFENELRSSTLCHGNGGNAMLFLETYRSYKDPVHLNMAEETAARMLASKEKSGVYFSGLADAGMQEDTSLFMGNAGIGYFYLQVLSPFTVPSLLSPNVQGSFNASGMQEYPVINISKAEMKRKLLRKMFNRTICLLEKITPDAFNTYLQAPHKIAELKKEFKKFIAMLCGTLSSHHTLLLKDIFNLESERMSMDEKVLSNALLHIQEEMLVKKGKQLTELSEEEFLMQRICLHPQIKLVETAWDWNTKECENEKKEPDEYCVLLKPGTMGVVEEPLSPFLSVILSALDERKTVKAIMKEVAENFEIGSAAEGDHLKELIVSQIKEALRSGIIIAEEAEVLSNAG